MPYARPTLSALRQQAQQDISQSGLAVDGFLQKAVLKVLAWVQAGFAWLHYGYLDWIAKQAVPWTATGEWLAGWMGLIGVTQKPAAAAQITVTFTGVNGTVIPNGSSFARLDGFAYTSTAAATIAAGSATVSMTAATPGSAGNVANGATVALASSIAGVNSSGTVASTVASGVDVEDPAAFKTRGLAQYAAPPQGGDLADFVNWALAVPGVTRAWVQPNAMGAGTVSVFTMFDVSEAAFGGVPQGTSGGAANEPRITPATGDLLTVANALFPKQQVTQLVWSVAPTLTATAFTVADLGVNNTPAMQTAITNALKGMFLQFANVGGTVNPAAAGAAWPAIEPNDWYAALNAIPGLNNFKVTTPSAAITVTAGQLASLGAITFVT
jgi:uncharacterized phage protein gp47/JayE